jgi:hypothetical protein
MCSRRGYARDHRLVEVRLTEQLASGTVTIVDGCVRLTRRGAATGKLQPLVPRQPLPRRRLLMGRYNRRTHHPVPRESACDWRNLPTGISRQVTHHVRM